MRVLALDYGAARCGCALSDPTGTLATPLAHIEPIPQKGDGLGGLELLPVIIFLAPFGVQIEQLHHVGQDDLGLDGVVFCVNEIGIIRIEAHARTTDFVNVRLVPLHLHAGGTRELLR